MAWDDIKKKLASIFTSESEAELGEDYVELEADMKESKAKIMVRSFTLTKYDDISDVLNSIREGYTIAILNIGPLKEKDITELKRAIDKIKKTVEANDGDIAGLGENLLVVTPTFARVWRREAVQKQEEKAPEIDEEI